jgi:hypothetical protein
MSSSFVNLDAVSPLGATVDSSELQSIYSSFSAEFVPLSASHKDIAKKYLSDIPENDDESFFIVDLSSIARNVARWHRCLQ